MTKPFRHGNNVQFRWVRRWWLCFPYAVLQFRERILADGISWNPDESWTKWGDVYTESEYDRR